MPDQGPPPSRPACLKPFVARWPQLRLHAIGLGRRSLFSPSELLTPQRQSRSQQQSAKAMGWALGLSRHYSLDTRDGDGDGQAHARPRAQQAIVIIRLRTTDDICDLPPPFSFPLPHTHTHAHTHDIGAYRAILPSRLLPNPLVTVRSSSSSDIPLSSLSDPFGARARSEEREPWLRATVSHVLGVRHRDISRHYLFPVTPGLAAAHPGDQMSQI